MKWTRVISMQEWYFTTVSAWDLGADIVEELQQMAEIDAAELPALASAFDPIAFQEANAGLKMEHYKLDQDQLLAFGMEATMLRMEIA